ncbi:MAG: HTR-like protein [Halobacteria archaeon]|nr:HTR-like protein [Halobacteria archaeon]
MSTQNRYRGRSKIPLGIPTLDSMFNGGVPSGSSILLSSDVGAGASEFAYTSAAMVSMARHDPELFSIYHDRGDTDGDLPEEVHYVSFVRGEDDVQMELESVLNDDMYGVFTDNMVFKDFSREYFHNTVVPRSWVEEDVLSLESLGSAGNGDDENVLSAFADYLDEHASNNLVIIDSLTELVRATKGKIEWGDLLVLLSGLQRACKSWNGLIYALVNKDTLEERKHQEIASIFDGIIHFNWEEGEMERQRTMHVGSFRGIMSELSEKENDKFETAVTGEGFEISSIRKIG